jgi:hypothetical protein
MDVVMGEPSSSLNQTLQKEIAITSRRRPAMVTRAAKVSSLSQQTARIPESERLDVVIAANHHAVTGRIVD